MTHCPVAFTHSDTDANPPKNRHHDRFVTAPTKEEQRGSWSLTPKVSHADYQPSRLHYLKAAFDLIALSRLLGARMRLALHQP